MAREPSNLLQFLMFCLLTAPLQGYAETYAIRPKSSRRSEGSVRSPQPTTVPVSMKQAQQLSMLKDYNPSLTSPTVQPRPSHHAPFSFTTPDPRTMHLSPSPAPTLAPCTFLLHHPRPSHHAPFSFTSPDPRTMHLSPSPTS